MADRWLKITGLGGEFPGDVGSAEHELSYVVRVFSSHFKKLVQWLKQRPTQVVLEVQSIPADPPGPTCSLGFHSGGAIEGDNIEGDNVEREAPTRGRWT
eukprot:8674211-Pyramimonas_sp.AAC.1